MFEGQRRKCSIDVGKKYELFKVIVRASADLTVMGYVTFGHCEILLKLLAVPNFVAFYPTEGEV